MPTTDEYSRALREMPLRDDQKMSFMLRAQLRAPSQTLAVDQLEKSCGLNQGGFNLFYGQWCKELAQHMRWGNSLQLPRYRDLISTESRNAAGELELTLRPEFVEALEGVGFS